MRYEGQIYRPPSEARSLILQATIGCSWNHCTYCDMYRDKTFRVRELDAVLEDVETAREQVGDVVDKVFVADGDGLIMGLDHWEPILEACRAAFPRLRRVSAYATAMNLLEKTPEELARLRELGLSLLYIGPESGDDVTLKKIAKGASFDDHVRAAEKAHAAGVKLSAIFLLGAGGVERSAEHAQGSANLAGAMDPRFVSLLTLTVIPGTPLGKQQDKGAFELPDQRSLLGELRTFVDEARPTDAIFRTNHASNYLPLAGRLPRDREKILEVVDAALRGGIALRPEWARGL
ncbi:MAG: radical SAM protein [Acidobacteria bacterium]|nr:radical SAM protein [Acidobacteriota bacterium]NIM60411.1 radical SAM protein [Acidobacteriota bacterium]NIO58586.1 radical SAM protein [Acidobacteriota bacterium]NIQ29638.1 radical SAM protein [Acidobacteriota bacterium]NIQ84355.1 radical SAM protein [Acidobacteriota bacterium]